MKPSKLRQGDRIRVDGYWLEVVRVNPTKNPGGMLQILFLNGRSILVQPDEDVETEGK